MCRRESGEQQKQIERGRTATAGAEGGGGETAVDDNVKCTRGLENTNKMRALRLNCTFNELKQKKKQQKMHRIKTEQKRMNVCDKSSSKEAEKEREKEKVERQRVQSVGSRLRLRYVLIAL